MKLTEEKTVAILCESTVIEQCDLCASPVKWCKGESEMESGSVRDARGLPATLTWPCITIPLLFYQRALPPPSYIGFTAPVPHWDRRGVCVCVCGGGAALSPTLTLGLPTYLPTYLQGCMFYNCVHLEQEFRHYEHGLCKQRSPRGMARSEWEDGSGQLQSLQQGKTAVIQ